MNPEDIAFWESAGKEGNSPTETLHSMSEKLRLARILLK